MLHIHPLLDSRDWAIKHILLPVQIAYISSKKVTLGTGRGAGRVARIVCCTLVGKSTDEQTSRRSTNLGMMPVHSH